MKNFFRNIEVILGSITISITVLSVIINVILRYGFGIQFAWIEEVSVGCFIWTVFLGATAAYKDKALIGVEVLTQALPYRGRRFLELIIYTLLFVLNATLFYLSYNYAVGSGKITAALEVSYIYINASIVFSFGMMTFYSLKFLIEDIISLIGGQEKAKKN
ncbi:TRAP transporter small permease [Psychrilyobacter sp.]|uniref:TRAP transporter small permease n=1 Tax=Psychrilyobacter sp. TaxID=2586924 RepID=UPI00301A1047